MVREPESAARGVRYPRDVGESHFLPVRGEGVLRKQLSSSLPLERCCPTARLPSRSSLASVSERTTGAADIDDGASTNVLPAVGWSSRPREPVAPRTLPSSAIRSRRMIHAGRPTRPRKYLRQARDLLTQAAGSVLLFPCGGRHAGRKGPEGERASMPSLEDAKRSFIRRGRRPLQCAKR